VRVIVGVAVREGVAVTVLEREGVAEVVRWG
jgi:hypothetical protein